jgi:DNA-binding transcriptional regulator YiaG
LAQWTVVDLQRLARANRLAQTGEARVIRERSGVSLRTLAAALGTNPGELSRWERGHSRPRPGSALRWLREVEKLRAELPDAATPPDHVSDGATPDLPYQVAPILAQGGPEYGTAPGAS